MTKRILTLAVLWLAGCVTSSITLATRLNKIHVGTPRAEVIEILGKPDSTRSNAEVEYLVYTLWDRITVGKYAGDMESGKYFIKLVGGRVESAGRIGPSSL